MKRIWHPFWLWEDIEMWRKLPREEEGHYLERAMNFTGNADLYGNWMLRVLEECPVACEHNLSERGMNRQAWIGHAAVNLAIQCPEYITRQAWGLLTEEQRDKANLKADYAINLWEQRNKEKGGQLRLEME